MRLEHESSRNLEKEILKAIDKHLDLNQYKVFFFGSRVNGKGGERSDIDIGIEGKEPIPMKLLGNIQDSIDAIPTLYKIEVVDFKQVPPDFYKVATQTIEPINLNQT